MTFVVLWLTVSRKVKNNMRRAVAKRTVESIVLLCCYLLQYLYATTRHYREGHKEHVKCPQNLTYHMRAVATRALPATTESALGAI